MTSASPPDPPTTQAAPEWTIRPTRPGDERLLVELFTRAYGRSVTEAHWRWKLQQLPSPVPNGWQALDGELPIFHSAGIPIRYQLPDGQTTAMVSVDTMTSPDYRRRGLLTLVGRRMYATWQAAGVRFVIGLINDQWGSRAAALGWQPLFPLRWLIRPLRPSALLARRLRLPPLARLTPVDALWNMAWDRQVESDPYVRLRAVDDVGPELDALWARCAHDSGISIVRDRAWVAWRYLANPSYPYRVLLAERAGEAVGYAVYRLEHAADHTLGYIAELFAARRDPRALGSLIRQTTARLEAEGAELAVAQAPPGTWMSQAMRRAGFRWSWGDFSVQLVPLDATLPLEALRDARNWTMWGGDFDSI